jgi:hypothetical protein
MLYCSGCYRLVIQRSTSMKIPSYLQYSQSDPHEPHLLATIFGSLRMEAIWDHGTTGEMWDRAEKKLSAFVGPQRPLAEEPT